MFLVSNGKGIKKYALFVLCLQNLLVDDLKATHKPDVKVIDILKISMYLQY